MEERTQIEKRNRTKWLRQAGLVVGLLGAGLATVVYSGFTWEVFGPFAVIIPILVLDSVLITVWKKPLIGGICWLLPAFPCIFWPSASGIWDSFYSLVRRGRKYLERSTWNILSYAACNNCPECDFDATSLLQNGASSRRKGAATRLWREPLGPEKG